MGRRVKVPLSAARATLFALADQVRTSDTVVVLEHRGSREQVALVREARLDYLENRVQELEKLAPKPPKPFKLAGSATTDLTDEELDQSLRAIRREWVPRRVREEMEATTRPRRRRR